MARFENSVDLFGKGAGASTSAEAVCEWCGTEYSGQENSGGEVFHRTGAIGFTNFGTLQVLDCCYEKVEKAVLSRMDDILPWFIRILESKRQALEQQEELVAKLRETLS